MKNFLYGNWQALALIAIAFGLIVLAFSGFLNPDVRSSLNPLVSAQAWLSARFNAIYEFLTVPRDVASLRARNTELENEKSLLQTQVIQLQQQLNEAQILYALLDFARTRPQDEYIAGAVIGQDPSPFLHYVIIDRGSDVGLRHGMPVVTQQGLVGRIDKVTASAARVQLITDPSAVINVRLQSTKDEGIITGSITGDVNLDMISPDAELQPGELILTSGLGGNYPADIVIGQVMNVRKNENDLFQTATIQPTVDFSTLNAVLVIANFQPANIEPLIATPSAP